MVSRHISEAITRDSLPFAIAIRSDELLQTQPERLAENPQFTKARLFRVFNANGVILLRLYIYICND